MIEFLALYSPKMVFGLIALAVFLMRDLERRTYNKGLCSCGGGEFIHLSFYTLESRGFFCSVCDKIRWLAFFTPKKYRNKAWSIIRSAIIVIGLSWLLYAI